MKNIEYIRTYDSNLLEGIIRGLFPCYDLWSLRSFENQHYEFISGNCTEIEKFSQYISTHANQANPAILLLVLGNSEKNYPTIMLNTRKVYMVIGFVDYSNYLGTPLIL
jgi:hypothetical protein